MNKWTRRKSQIQASKGSQPGIHFQEDLANLIRVKKRTLGIKVAKGQFHLPVVEGEMVMIATAVMRNQTKESYGTLNLAGKFLSLKVILCKSKIKTEKGWWPNR